MSSINAISSEKLARLIGTHRAPVLIDVRTDEDFAADPRFIPASIRRDHRSVSQWAEAFVARAATVICQRGGKLSEGTAAWLRHNRAPADILEGGYEAWTQAGGALVAETKLPPRNEDGRTIWVTRARPKVDRIACP
ncbi:Putative superoxide dismutase SodM-like protein [Methylocystis sp. SC2]|nr:Putative superoxide dismutase SodM-like protein [Methylocystis sp. SC2]